MSVLIRPLKSDEYIYLDDYLYLSIFQKEGKELIPRSVLNDPVVRLYTKDFGKAADDHALCAVSEGSIVGIIWARIINGYGSIDKMTPELALSVLPSYRGQGIGTKLMEEMLLLLENAGYERCSLSVQKRNRAHLLYLRLGFEVYREDENEYILFKRLGGHGKDKLPVC